MSDRKPLDSTRFAIAADDLDAAVEKAFDHLKALADDEGHRGFVLPELVEETIERIEGEWTRVFRFRAELLPAVK